MLVKESIKLFVIKNHITSNYQYNPLFNQKLAMPPEFNTTRVQKCLFKVTFCRK